jgi:adenylate cyclase
VRDKLDFSFEDMGEQEVKNIARPVRTHRIVVGSTAQPITAAAASTELSLPEKPSLVVLPFQNMTGDAEQEYFVDGMVEEITTAIARLPWLFVIARNSAFTYKGAPIGRSEHPPGARRARDRMTQAAVSSLRNQPIGTIFPMTSKDRL